MGRYKDNIRIRNYRRLRRKARAYKNRRIVIRFFLNKIVPFVFLRMFLKKYFWLTWGSMLLAFLLNFGNPFVGSNNSELKTCRNELCAIKTQLNEYKSLVKDQNKLIASLQDDRSKWKNYYTNLKEAAKQLKNQQSILNQNEKDFNKTSKK